MKLFAIVTAGLMATAGGSYYLFGTSHCSTGTCGLAPVAKSGGCPAADDLPDCCARQDECCAVREACCAVATNVTASTKTSDCCAAKADCCVVGAACCFGAEKVTAAVKPVEFDGCCGSSAVTPTRTVTTAATSIVSAK